MKIAVLGSSGAMGSFFVRYFLGQGNSVVGYDRLERRDSPAGFTFVDSNPEAVRGAQVVLLAVPIRETLKVVREVAGSLGKGCTLIEITSVKGRSFGQIEEALARRKVSLLSLHPLFGPSFRSRDFKMCVVGRKPDFALAKRLFPGAELIRLSPEAHDRLMAHVLSLVHLMNLAFVSTIAKGIGVDGFSVAATPIASAQLTVAEAVLSQDPSLYSYIQVENAFVLEALSSLIAELRGLRKTIERKDARSFERRFSALAGEFSVADMQAALRRVYSRSGS